MAPSQVEIASSSSSFSCVLKDNSRKDQHRCRYQNSNPNLKSQRNFKELVRDHLNSCICISPNKSSSDSLSNNENSHHHQATGGFSCWGCSSSNNNSRSNTIPGGGSGGDNGDSNKARNRDLDDKPMPTISRRQSWVLDRWAAQQARETMTTIAAESLARLMPSSSIAASPSPSPVPSDTSSNDLSVSSLVQKWRGYENKNQNHKQTHNDHNHTQPSGNGVVLSRASSVSATGTENASSVEACETSTVTADETFCLNSSPNNDEESESSVREGEFDQTTLSHDQVFSAPCAGDAGGELGQEGERERMRVVDIIRKWTSTTRQRSRTGSNENETEPQPVALPPLARVVEKGGDHKGAIPVACSPRLRGRQAIADLFMKMEKERRKEIEGLTARQAVTKFAQRGRIQSMLRLRFLRHEPVEDQRRHHPKACGLNRSQPNGSITNLRERINEASDRRGNTNTKSLPRVTSKGNLDMEKASTSDHPTQEMTRCEENSHEQINDVLETRHVEINREEIHQEELDHGENSHEEMKEEVVINHEEVSDGETNHEEVNCQEQNVEQPIDGTLEESSMLHPAEDIQVENVPSSDAICQNICSGACNVDCQESCVYIVETSYNELEEDLIYEEQEDSNQRFLEANLDWINDVSRPCGYWEDRRQTRYKEAFESASTNEEIRQLIERRSVSAALTSAFRQRMDQLMMSCMQRRMHGLDNEESKGQSVGVFLQGRTESLGVHEEQQYEEQVDHEQEREDQDQECREELVHEEEGEGEQGNRVDDEDEQQEYYEEQTPRCGSYHHNDSDYFDQSLSSSQMPWSHYHEDSDDSEQMGSTPFQLSSTTNSYGHVAQDGSSLKNVPSIEMELIYDLRTHMEQLRREMSELRRTLKSCMGMQLMIQKTMREEVSATVGHSEREEKRVGTKKTRKKGDCCICYAKKVDSLLYKCGHMCTCFDCASELQWSSGKCPICRAEVVDVVRAYPET